MMNNIKDFTALILSVLGHLISKIIIFYVFYCIVLRKLDRIFIPKIKKSNTPKEYAFFYIFLSRAPFAFLVISFYIINRWLARISGILYLIFLYRKYKKIVCISESKKNEEICVNKDDKDNIDSKFVSPKTYELMQCKQMLDEGLIREEDYERKKNEILGFNKEGDNE